MSRRQAALAGVAGGLAVLNAAQAQAFLGIGEKSAEEVYKEDTVRMQRMHGLWAALSRVQHP